ncbi:MAG: protein phosphatase 2C domain-containing protein [Bryobacteraceae bacterium]
MLEAYGLSDPGCVRKNNEDSYLIEPALGLCLLADGMGGAQAGETASLLAVQTAADFIRSAPVRSETVLRDSFDEANRTVLAKAASEVQYTGMGTTMVGLLDNGDEIAIASVGDSRAYLFNNGGLQPLTEDQTWANEVGRKLGLDDERLRNHPFRHVLTMAIGVDNTLRINSRSLRLGADSLVLLCSDGLHGVVSQENIVSGLKNLGTLEAKCHYLIEAARKAGGPDNITAILVRKL